MYVIVNYEVLHYYILLSKYETKEDTGVCTQAFRKTCTASSKIIFYTVIKPISSTKKTISRFGNITYIAHVYTFNQFYGIYGWCVLHFPQHINIIVIIIYETQIPWTPIFT